MTKWSSGANYQLPAGSFCCCCCCSCLINDDFTLARCLLPSPSHVTITLYELFLAARLNGDDAKDMQRIAPQQQHTRTRVQSGTVGYSWTPTAYVCFFLWLLYPAAKRILYSNSYGSFAQKRQAQKMSWRLQQTYRFSCFPHLPRRWLYVSTKICSFMSTSAFLFFFSSPLLWH